MVVVYNGFCIVGNSMLLVRIIHITDYIRWHCKSYYTGSQTNKLTIFFDQRLHDLLVSIMHAPKTYTQIMINISQT